MHSYVRQVTGYRPSTCKPLDNVDYMPKTPRGPVASHLVCPFLRWPSTAFHTCTHDVRGARSSTKHEWRPAGGVHTMTRVIENTNDFVITQSCSGGGQARRCLISSHLISSHLIVMSVHRPSSAHLGDPRTGRVHDLNAPDQRRNANKLWKWWWWFNSKDLVLVEAHPWYDI